MAGWVKLHRKVLENPIVCKDPQHLAVWVYLLLNATHAQTDAVFRGKRITLMPGQLLTGRKSISTFLKVDESKVQRILKRLEIEQQIEQQTSSQNRLITIVKWGLYQNDEQRIEQQVNNECTTSEQRVNTNKNDKNVKNEKNVRNNYAEFVSMTEEEHKKLITEYGDEAVKKMIGTLDNYKGSSGKKYKSDYRAILSWVVNEVKKTSPGIIQQTSSPDTEESANPFEKFKRKDEKENG